MRARWKFQDAFNHVIIKLKNRLAEHRLESVVTQRGDGVRVGQGCKVTLEELFRWINWGFPNF